MPTIIERALEARRHEVQKAKDEKKELVERMHRKRRYMFKEVLDLCFGDPILPSCIRCRADRSGHPEPFIILDGICIAATYRTESDGWPLECTLRVSDASDVEESAFGDDAGSCLFRSLSELGALLENLPSLIPSLTEESAPALTDADIPESVGEPDPEDLFADAVWSRFAKLEERLLLLETGGRES